MLGRLLPLMCIWTLTAAVEDVKWYSKRLAEETYREVNNRFIAVRPWDRVIQVDEWSYRHWILSRNPHFNSAVLLIDSFNPVHGDILDVFRSVAHHSYRTPTEKGFGGEGGGDATTYFFYVDVRTPGCDWIVNLHQLKHIPDLLFFRAGKIGQTNGIFGVDSFNEWVSTNAASKWKFNERELFEQMSRFCEVNAKSASKRVLATSNLRYILRHDIALMKSVLWMLPVIIIFVALLIYTTVYRQCLLLRLGSVALYTVNVTCFISAIANYTPAVGLIEGFQWPPLGILQKFYFELGMSHYFNENVIVSLMFCILSATLLTLRKCVAFDRGVFTVLLFTLGLIVTAWYTISLLYRKGVPFCVDWIAESSIPRGSIDMECYHLF
ncbi:hypothetical protein BOVATA_018310 [Babesia ovata]|uniref:Uncharacterized protein n=1 Tax=Babesia ovata TaxID=189622 RepID=A0A2H6KBG7_9APIC|nr:uncharacterized protein BOVATA_018310 [Babesia ovata]GBE60338.1 hypothetical protein BOVATA_018310 [Babesia ovata]